MPTENLPVTHTEIEDNILNHDNQQQFLTFNLQGELFAIGILNIKEIIDTITINEILSIKIISIN
jgi:chemotaxis signal transduction protein